MPEEGFRQKIDFVFNEEGRLAATSGVSLSEETLRAAIGSKSVSLAYEHEWRYIEPAEGKYDLPGPLVEIVFECAVSIQVAAGLLARVRMGFPGCYPLTWPSRAEIGAPDFLPSR